MKKVIYHDPCGAEYLVCVNCGGSLSWLRGWIHALTGSKYCYAGQQFPLPPGDLRATPR